MHPQHSALHSMYYVAIVCTPEIDNKVLHFKNRMREHFGCTAALKSPAHITLIPPFWMDEVKETDLIDTLHSFKCDLFPLPIELNNFSHFSNRVLFVQVNDNIKLDELRIQTESHFLHAFKNEIRKEDRPFHPHVTIANRDVSPAAFEKAWLYFSKEEFVATFMATSVSILKLSDGRWNVIAEQ